MNILTLLTGITEALTIEMTQDLCKWKRVLIGFESCLLSFWILEQLPEEGFMLVKGTPVRIQTTTNKQILT